jgi:hypothetical protein
MLVRAADDLRERDGMLAKHPVDVMLTATDLGAAKQFYGDRIGLNCDADHALQTFNHSANGGHPASSRRARSPGDAEKCTPRPLGPFIG